MNKYDLSVIIPGRNEMFIAETVKNVLANIRANTEVIVVLDGEWANPPLIADPRLTIIYTPNSWGQRGATNQGVRIASGKYVMKLDAHCVVDEGFDTKLLADMVTLEESGKYLHYTLIPTLYNLHAFDWVCIGSKPRSGELFETDDFFAEQNGCGERIYQGPTPKSCPKCGGNMERELVFKPRWHKKSMYYRFDKTFHFKYWGAYKERPEAIDNDLVEIMSTQGSCFMITREKYWQLNISDEKAAGKSGWGQQGVEVALKTWLSGGGLYSTKHTWYAHMFRTQGGDFGFPYPLSGSEQEEARIYSRNLWSNDKWPLAKHSLAWFLEKFKPIPEWHDESIQTPELVNIDKNMPTREIIFYTDNQLRLKYAHKVQDALKQTGIPIISASLKPMPHFGDNIHIPLERGLLAYFTQIISALQKSTADIVYMCEHDVIYHQSHFEFIPPTKDKFYFNQNFWRIRPEQDDFAVHWDANQVSGLVCYRELLLDWYKKKFDQIIKSGFDRSYEPGGRDPNLSEAFKSKYPNIDIRHGGNMTKSKWSLDDFRDKSTSKGWDTNIIEQIPGWDLTRADFL